MSEEFIEFKSLLAELIATYGMVFFCSMIAMHADAGNLGLLGVGVANFLILAMMVYLSFSTSGAQLNPAVTLGFVVTRKMGITEGIFYIISQLIASVLAGISLFLIAGDDLLLAAEGKSRLGFPHLSSSYPLLNGLLIETLLTFFLVMVIWAIALDDRLPSYLIGIGVGGVVGFSILVGAPLTGAALNPVRVFGPALIMTDFANHWIYWVGPIVGGILAASIYNTVFLDEDSLSDYSDKFNTRKLNFDEQDKQGPSTRHRPNLLEQLNEEDD